MRWTWGETLPQPPDPIRTVLRLVLPPIVEGDLILLCCLPTLLLPASACACIVLILVKLEICEMPPSAVQVL
eukprot:1544894-Pyramimonas_sp.AAC.1